MSGVQRRKAKEERKRLLATLPLWRVELDCGCCNLEVSFATEERLRAQIAAGSAEFVDDAGTRHSRVEMVCSYERIR